jgi:5-hydroxyisourate hydrolase
MGNASASTGSHLSTHVLDTSRGRAAAGVGVVLEVRTDGGWRELSRAATDSDGRCAPLLADGTTLTRATYRLTFATGPYFATQGVTAFHPEVSVVFDVREPQERHHVPLLLSPFGYTTYRGT